MASTGRWEGVREVRKLSLPLLAAAMALIVLPAEAAVWYVLVTGSMTVNLTPAASFTLCADGACGSASGSVRAGFGGPAAGSVQPLSGAPGELVSLSLESTPEPSRAETASGGPLAKPHVSNARCASSTASSTTSRIQRRKNGP
ncbi:MAG: hypothetical protein IT186_13620 [Acidobacteria bacterium]|nr:hypothetical protein [Acidobacteriota bacterium]MCG3195217.1 hypothetical protein [Thermoanaerobaculia bacterium]